MKNRGQKIFIMIFLLVQLIAPAQAMLAAPLASANDHQKHCQTVDSNTIADSTLSVMTPCKTHCLNADQVSDTAQDQMSSCGGDNSCSTSCNNCSHSNVMLLNEFITMHQAASHSPLQSSYDIYKYFPPLKLRPPRV